MMESIRIISKEVCEGSRDYGVSKVTVVKTGKNIGYNKGTEILNSNMT